MRSKRSGCPKSLQVKEMHRAKMVLVIFSKKVAVDFPRMMLKPPGCSNSPQTRGILPHKITSVAFIRQGVVGYPRTTVRLFGFIDWRQIRVTL